MISDRGVVLPATAGALCHEAEVTYGNGTIDMETAPRDLLLFFSGRVLGPDGPYSQGVRHKVWTALRNASDVRT